LVFSPLLFVSPTLHAVSAPAGPPATLGAAAAAHWILMGRWSEWHGGESWGPRMMTDALPLLFVFLPDGFNLMPRVAPALAVVSVAVQALGAFSYDYRWERLYRRGGGDEAALWDVAHSPIPFYLQRRTVILAMPAVKGGRAQVREHPVVIAGPAGSRVLFSSDPPRVDGAVETLEDVHLQRGARVEDGRVRLRGRWDGVQFRVTPEARRRRLELRISGRGQGVLYVGEKTFWSEQPRWATFPVSGVFRLRHPYYFPESGGPDLIVTIGKSPGEVDLESMALVPPGDPENPVRIP
jgi:hypothetical protein